MTRAEDVSGPSPLVSIGYWRSADEPQLPEPGRFVDLTWDADERAAVVEYLRRVPFAVAAGGSFCRLGCEHCNGSGVCSHGRFEWPEGLAHYVADHGVRLPDEFVAHALGRSSAPPTLPTDWWSRQPGFAGRVRSYLTNGRERGEARLRLAPDVGQPDAAAIRFARRFFELPIVEVRRLLGTGQWLRLPPPMTRFEVARLSPPPSIETQFEEVDAMRSANQSTVMLDRLVAELRGASAEPFSRAVAWFSPSFDPECGIVIIRSGGGWTGRWVTQMRASRGDPVMVWLDPASSQEPCRLTDAELAALSARIGEAATATPPRGTGVVLDGCQFRFSAGDGEASAEAQGNLGGVEQSGARQLAVELCDVAIASAQWHATQDAFVALRGYTG